MSVFTRSIVAAAALFAMPFSASASDYKVDVSHSTVGFSVTHLMVGTTRGEFTDFEGTVKYVEGSVEKTEIEATVKIKSLDTRDVKRDEHLLTPDFFDEPKYPTMTFKSTAIKKVRGNTFKMVGDLTLHGVSKSVVFDVEGLDQEVLDPWGNYHRGAIATTTINRQDFGVSWNGTLDSGGVVVGDEVEITLEIELIRQ